MVKWTAEIDQILLLKILETSQLNADAKAISDAWPETLEKPTPRAISERLVKIRQNAKTKGAASHFSVSAAKTKNPTQRVRKNRKTLNDDGPVHASKGNGKTASPYDELGHYLEADDDETYMTPTSSADGEASMSMIKSEPGLIAADLYSTPTKPRNQRKGNVNMPTQIPTPSPSVVKHESFNDNNFDNGSDEGQGGSAYDADTIVGDNAGGGNAFTSVSDRYEQGFYNGAPDFGV